MFITAPTAAKALERYVGSAAQTVNAYSYPLISSCNLDGLADASTKLLQAGTVLPFFSVSKGQNGSALGYNRPLRYSETTLDGPGAQLPASVGFVATTLGVAYSPAISQAIKGKLDLHASFAYVRDSLRLNLGPVWAHPEGTFHVQSCSVATTIPNALVQYGTNGRVGARQLPMDAYYFFPPKSTISFEVTIHEDIYVTSDGLPWNGGYINSTSNPGNGYPSVDGAPIQVVMEGWRFEEASA